MSTTWIVVLLAAGWLTTRILMQARLNASHRLFLQRRRERREEALARPDRALAPVRIEDLRHLPQRQFLQLRHELAARGFQHLGAYEDVQFNKAFPHLRTAFDCHTSADGAIVATVSVLNEKRWFKRLLLAVRGVPARSVSVKLITTHKNAAPAIITLRNSHDTKPPRTSEIRDPKTGRAVSLQTTLPAKTGLDALIDAHQAARENLAKSAQPPPQPIIVHSLDQVLNPA